MGSEWQSDDGAVRLYCGDNLEVLAGIEGESIDSIVTDPPYGLSFMGKHWDYDVPGVEVWRECLRVLKPGGHLLSFGGTRTYHRLVVAIEDAGFEIRDTVAWLYGSGFPKSLDVPKAIDNAAGVKGGRGSMKRGGERLLRQTQDGARDGGGTWGNEVGRSAYTYAPATPAAAKWQGFGTALKPAHEPICLARKPLIGTVAENVLTHGTGAINVDGCRINPGDIVPGGGGGRHGATWEQHCGTGMFRSDRVHKQKSHNIGRWPANVIHDGSEEVLAGFPESKGDSANRKPRLKRAEQFGWSGPAASDVNTEGFADSGSAARFFYCAKASKADREEGLDGCEADTTDDGRQTPIDNPYMLGKTIRRNTHPTVKPTDLMRYLCRLITPPGGIVLDPFNGSGSTGKAAVLESFRYIGIEREREHVEVSIRRIQHALGVGPVSTTEPTLF